MAASDPTSPILTGSDIRTPALPFELWVHILGSVTDSCYLPRIWLHCRRVSHAFRAATEMAFADVYLPQMKVCVELSRLLELSFDGLSGDRTRARFRHRPGAADGEARPLRIPVELQRRLDEEPVRLWTREQERYLKSLDDGTPTLLYTTWLMGLVEDAAFPDLEVDFSERRLSFTWRPMLSMMFGEIEHRRRMSMPSIADQEETEADAWPGENDTDTDSDIYNSERLYRIELQVRKQRSRNHAWGRRYDAERRQNWQLKALLGYRQECSASRFDSQVRLL